MAKTARTPSAASSAEAETRMAVLQALEAADAKKAENVKVLELGKDSGAFTDYFVICTGSNPRQIQAISDEVEQRLTKAGMEPTHVEGYQQAEWVLLDYVDFVIHVFSEHARKFYDLERLWKSAKQVTPAELTATRRGAPATRPRTTGTTTTRTRSLHPRKTAGASSTSRAKNAKPKRHK
jgi:ribosome-associated protein